MSKKMVHFNRGIDIRCRIPSKPTVARFDVSVNNTRFIVIGTEYGFLRTAGGDVRTWKTYSGAFKAAKNYRTF